VQRDTHDDREHAGPMPCVWARPTNKWQADERAGGRVSKRRKTAMVDIAEACATHANRERGGRMSRAQTPSTNAHGR